MTASEDALADAWVRAVDPDPDPSLWPRPDEGRSGREVALEAVLLYALARPPYQPTEADNDVLDLLDDLERAAAVGAKPREEPLCSHCGLAPVKVRRTRGPGGWVTVDLCARCDQYRRTHDGRLPSRRHNHFQARKTGKVA